ncbi:hypothetical protein XF24_00617 [candidate division SR1 bacterium Aalborg_AAW-1]|nr:hypothetical protein XF24_00617 [candidate division SR1 bacterium Aalborg_AAW-1]
MDTLALEQTQIDIMIQEVWINLSETEREEFLKEMGQVDQAYQLEIETALQHTLSL